MEKLILSLGHLLQGLKFHEQHNLLRSFFETTEQAQLVIDFPFRSILHAKGSEEIQIIFYCKSREAADSII